MDKKDRFIVEYLFLIRIVIFIHFISLILLEMVILLLTNIKIT